MTRQVSQVPEPTNSEIEALTAAAGALLERMNDVDRSSGATILHLAQVARSNRRLIRVTIAGLVLDAALTIAMAIGGMSITANSHRIDQVNARLDAAQTVQRAKALCPLYRIFLDSEQFTPPNQTPEQAASRVEAFRVIHEGYEALECAKLPK